MNVHCKAFWEEIEYYKEQNQVMAVDDLLREVFGKKPLHKVKIQENEKRIENLNYSLMDIM